MGLKVWLPSDLREGVEESQKMRSLKVGIDQPMPLSQEFHKNGRKNKNIMHKTIYFEFFFQLVNQSIMEM